MRRKMEQGKAAVINNMNIKQNQPQAKIERVAVILPAYNEEATIRETMLGFHRALPQAAIFIIDNNSSDRTTANAQNTLNELGISGSVIAEARRGKGNAVRCAFMTIDADLYLLADADLTYPSERAPELLLPISEGKADMVGGDRPSGGHYAKRNKRRFHSLGNHLVQGTINLLFGSKLTDVMSGYRVFSRRFVKNYPILVEGFQIETDMTLHALHHRFRILEIPVEYRDRPAGSSSKLSTFVDGTKVIFTSAQIFRYYRPLLFFSLLSALFAALPVFRDWIEIRFIKHVPLAILAAALEMVAIMLLGMGLTLDSFTYHHRRAYEMKLLDPDRPTAK